MNSPYLVAIRSAIALTSLFLMNGVATSAEMAILSELNWNEWVPAGKEVDCIYGDVVVRNQHLIAVIAQPIAGRNANMTVRDVAGAVIDLSTRASDNDQLSAYYPGAAVYELRAIEGEDATMNSGQFHYRIRSRQRDDQPTLEVLYTLNDEPYLTVQTTYTNPHQQPISVAAQDSVRADRSFEFAVDPAAGNFSAHDSWWRYAFAAIFENATPIAFGESIPRGRPVLALTTDGEATSFELASGEQRTITRRLLVADSQLALRGQLDRWRKQPTCAVNLNVIDHDGPVSNALITVQMAEKAYSGRTDPLGRLQFSLPPGEHTLAIEALGRPPQQVRIDAATATDTTVKLEPPGYVRGRIRDPQGRRIPCKVEFRATSAGDQGSDPFFGPDTYAEAVHNLVYTASGQFRQAIAPGTYEVLISHGPEFDAIRQTVVVTRGTTTPLVAVLRRTVDTPGWISADFHSHSSPSGDNTSAQDGRVLNLLAEHIEFGPCTEHNRVSSYAPHLHKYGATERMATCTGMELTGNPLPVNHQNAFPLQHHPHTQDGGGPSTDENPVVQIERLAFWDQRSQKVVQGNHPNLMQILGDQNNDGKPDGGFARMLGAMDVVEVHPPADIFNFPTQPTPPRERTNVMFNWLQLLNQGYRIPGVVNTDAHYNFHGSGWLRNYLKSSTDDPNQVKTADIIAASENGNIVMSNGPYLEVTATSEVGSESRTASPGDDLAADGGVVDLSVRVQCANWVDVNRVQLFLNGRPSPQHNFRRATHPNLFAIGTVKFDETLKLQLNQDTHVIVAVIGEGQRLGPVAGPDHQDDAPVAVANPIYVDVHADGFQPNGDTLGVALPR